MSDELNPMDKFKFLIGRWKLKYKVPGSKFSSEDIGEGEGEFKSILNNQYVTFDYHAKLSAGEASAHGIFAWDKKYKVYKYWWFEDSGEFMEAACDFINENKLFFNWHNSTLVQTFQQIENEKVISHMKYPTDKNDYKIVLEVVLTKSC
jgi:hypothetical protein